MLIQRCFFNSPPPGKADPNAYYDGIIPRVRVKDSGIEWSPEVGKALEICYTHMCHLVPKVGEQHASQFNQLYERQQRIEALIKAVQTGCMNPFRSISLFISKFNEEYKEIEFKNEQVEIIRAFVSVVKSKYIEYKLSKVIHQLRFELAKGAREEKLRFIISTLEGGFDEECILSLIANLKIQEYTEEETKRLRVMLELENYNEEEINKIISENKIDFNKQKVDAFIYNVNLFYKFERIDKKIAITILSIGLVNVTMPYYHELCEFALRAQEEEDFIEFTSQLYLRKNREKIYHNMRMGWAKMLELKESSWNPHQKAVDLMKEIALRGPLLIQASAGKPHFSEEPQLDCSSIPTVWYWQNEKNLKQEMKGRFHSILLVGVNCEKKEVYFIDALDPSDPVDVRRTFYKIRYSTLQKNVATVSGIWYEKRESIPKNSTHFAWYSKDFKGYL